MNLIIKNSLKWLIYLIITTAGLILSVYVDIYIIFNGYYSDRGVLLVVSIISLIAALLITIVLIVLFLILAGAFILYLRLYQQKG